MPKTHDLKCWPEEFAAIDAERKTHEIRVDDRGYAQGDVLVLREWEPDPGRYTGRSLEVGVTHLTHGPKWGLAVNLAVMSIAVLHRGSAPLAVVHRLAWLTRENLIQWDNSLSSDRVPFYFWEDQKIRYCLELTPGGPHQLALVRILPDIDECTRRMGHVSGYFPELWALVTGQSQAQEEEEGAFEEALAHLRGLVGGSRG